MHFVNIVCLLSLLAAVPSVTDTADPAVAADESVCESFAVVSDSGNLFVPVHRTVYFLEDTVPKDQPSKDSEDTDMLDKYSEALLTGESDGQYQQIRVGDAFRYVERDTFTDDADVIEDKKEADRKREEEIRKEAERKAEEERKKQEEKEAEEKRIEEERAAQEAAKASMSGASEITVEAEMPVSSWGGSVLTRSAGVNYGPSGKETYYNLDMSGVVGIMRSMGNNDPYWVRDDGAKMLGDYVMVAANLGVHPRGSLVETSLGTGIVCDTGGFAAGNPTQLDIATNW